MAHIDSEYALIPERKITRYSVERKLRSFSSLPIGWRYGEGGPISSEVIEVALSLAKEAQSNLFFEMEAFPSANGAILLGVHNGAYYLEFVITNTSNISIVLEKAGQEIDDLEELTLAEAKEQIAKLRKRIWMQSGYSIRENIVTDSEGLLALPSVTPEKTQEFLSSTVNAFFSLVQQYVPTSEDTIKIQDQPGSRQFTGGSTLRYCPMASG